MKRHIFLCLIVCFPFVGEAQPVAVNANYYFSRIDGASGLSHNNVKAVLQDSYGFLWFGTRNRLNRYDGVSMNIFDCYDPEQKKRDNNISSLFEDKERKIWIGTDNGIFIFDPLKESFTFFNEPTEQQIKITDWVADMQADSDENIWIVVPKQGLFRYHTPTKKLSRYVIGNLDLPDQGNPQCMCMEQNGRIWIGTNGGGVYLYNKENDTFTQHLGDAKGRSLKNENIYTMCNYGDELALGIHEGRLLKFNKRKNTVADVNAPEVHYKIIRHLTRIDDELWVGTQAGLFIINELENQVIHLQEDPICDFSLSDNVVEKIYKDREGGVWIATMFGGLSHLSKKSIPFECYVPMSSQNTINSRRLREMREDNDGNIWIASEDNGLNIFNPKTQSFRHIGKAEGLLLDNNRSVKSLLLTNHHAYVGLFKNGLDVINLHNFQIKHYSGSMLNIDEASIYAICEDRYGRIWIGNGWNVYRSEGIDKPFVRMDIFGLNYIYDIQEDSKGFIWVATLGNGVYKYDPVGDKINHYTHNINDSASLSSNSVSGITETSFGDIWFATDRGGICLYNNQSDNFTSFSIADGLPDDVTHKIVEDKNHILWFGTNKGLVSFNPQSKAIKVFSSDNGLPFNEFNYKSSLMASNGKMYFGGLNGLIAFDPSIYESNTFVPPVYITSLSIYNKPINLQTPKSPLSKAIYLTEKIKLKHNQSNIGFKFVALSYTAPKSNKYAYKMEGIDKEWIYTSNTHSVSYVKLPPGNYRFCVRASNNDNAWNKTGACIHIEILPPWWFSKFAIALYILAFTGIVLYYLNRFKKKTEQHHAENQRIYISKKEKELYSAKLEFFTNIAHEIRTPVTLINGPLEAMMEMDIQDPEIQKSLHLMSKNTSDLMTLINQLLDFRKVDSHKFVLNFALVDISALLKSIYDSFETVARKRNKKMEWLAPAGEITVMADKGAMNKIFNNLLSNALRYSETFISVALLVENETLVICVKNDGETIPEDFREKIFEPFQQVNKNENTAAGSGIGLSLARSLSELHHGSLEYGAFENLNRFTLRIPLKQNGIQLAEISENEYVVTEYKNEKTNAELILIVEDNEEMLNFIAEKLQKSFAVEKAANGAEALKIVEEKNIDLVLSDVMMPVMDGFELCKTLKENIEYSHTPVVLLTAKNDLKSKIHGLEMGADAYVEKPFSMNHLTAQLNTILNNRRREKEAFMRKPFLPIQNIGMNKADEEFMQKMVNVIQENITDSGLNVENLADKMFMSRSNLHRKIKALTELTPIDFIRLIRLKKAAELIQSGKYRINEVCYLVGINSSSYFIKLFQKQFGMTPKEFEQQM
jgi:signal transduction histidine kinase/ligand-binding sensor domain-containing protein/DNA-binding response OmpR family regulator